LGIALIILMLDQLTKIAWWAHSDWRDTAHHFFFQFGSGSQPWRGVFFLADAGGWQRWFFTGLGVLAAGVMVYLLRMHAGQNFALLGLVFVAEVVPLAT